MDFTPQQRAKWLRDQERLVELERCRGDLWYLLTEVLDRGFDPQLGLGLTERIHKPICDWLDRNRDEEKIALCTRRKNHKTTIAEGLMIQEILRDPALNHVYWSTAPKLIEDMVSTLAAYIRDCERLRELDPVCRTAPDRQGKQCPFKLFPRRNLKFDKYQQGSGAIRLPRAGLKLKARGPIISFMTAATEGTGAHFNGCAIMDDVFGRNTVERSGVAGVIRWIKQTVYQVADSRRLRTFFTVWPGAEAMQDKWIKDSEWFCIKLPGAIAEDDSEFLKMIEANEKKIVFDPDYKFKNRTFWPVGYKYKDKESSLQRIRKEQSEAEEHFPENVMCDSEPAADKPWGVDCEHFTGINPTDSTPGIRGKGTLVCVSDPAPFLQGGYKGLTEKQRGDGTKDYWSIQLWKLQPRGQVVDLIIIKGIRSQEWEHQQGADQAAVLMRRGIWGSCSRFYSENADVHFPYMKKACMREGVPLLRSKQNGPLKLRNYNKADLKNTLFTAFAEKAKRGEVWICNETVSREFLYGDNEHTGFLTQSRKYRKTGMNKNNLRFDDDANCGSFTMDPEILELAPEGMGYTDDDWDDDEHYQRRSRYCAA